jgi:hypothetical protein
MPGKNLAALGLLLSLSTFACSGDSEKIADPAFGDDGKKASTHATKHPDSGSAPTQGSTTVDVAGDAASDAGTGDAQVVADAGAALPVAPACKLDTRIVYTQSGRELESVTAYGQYWSRELKGGVAVEGVGFPHPISNEPKFVNGPCAGKATCTLDSRAIWFDGTTKIESTTAYGTSWSWTFDAQGGPVNQGGFPQAITAATAFRDGPCAYAGSSACVFDSRTLESTNAGRVETVTAYGRWFEYLVGPTFTRTALVVGQLLETIPRLAAGACESQAAGACTLDTRTIYTDLAGNRREEITARGRLWAYRLDANGGVIATVTDGTALVDIPRFAGPCAH